MKKLFCVFFLFNLVLISSDILQSEDEDSESSETFVTDEESSNLLSCLLAFTGSSGIALKVWEQYGCCEIMLCQDSPFLAYPFELLIDTITTLNDYELTPCRLGSFSIPIIAGTSTIIAYKLLQKYKAQYSK